MLLALILKGREEHLKAAKQLTKRDDAPTTTLVVAKLSVLPQWEEELQSKTSLSYLVYYGASNKNVSAQDLQAVDVVVTTYGTVQGDLNRKSPVLLNSPWLRVILDEAHCIRNHRTVASNACCQLDASHRWAVSGTIVQNSLDDVYGIMKFLRHEPWCLSTFWKTAITTPMLMHSSASDEEEDTEAAALRQESTRMALDRVRRLLAPIMLRRTKDSLTKDGKPILTLPEKEIKTIRIDFSEAEREFYNAVLARSQHIFEGYIETGKASTSYIQIFAMLSKLRQVCCHISLTVQTRLQNDEVRTTYSKGSDAKPAGSPRDVLGTDFLRGLIDKFYSSASSPRKKTQESDDSTGEGSPTKRPRQDQTYVSQVASTVASIVQENATHLNEECAICLEAPRIEDAVLTPCAHIYCQNCLVGFLRQKAGKETGLIRSFFCPDGECPNCNAKIEAKHIIALTRSPDDGKTVSTRFLLDRPAAATFRQEARATREDSPHAFARQILESAVGGMESSKMTAVMQELHNVWGLDPGSKVLVFSHYLGFLDLLQVQFRKQGIPFFRLDGSLTLKERMSVLEQFRSKEQPSVDSSGNDVQKGTVLLMSMTAGAEGLNLASASSCFICDPWWNYAKEDQCVSQCFYDRFVSCSVITL